MYSEEETELRDLIIQNLENCGFLSKIKAELRAGVFLALEEDGNLKNKIPLFNGRFDDFISTAEGKLMLSLVREFLEYFSLNFTLSVFDPEVASSTSYVSRSDLCDQLNLRTSEINGPVISALLKDVIGDRNRNSVVKSHDEISTVPEKPVTSIANETFTEKITLDNAFNHQNIDLGKEKSLIYGNSERDSFTKSSNDDLKEVFNSTISLSKADAEDNDIGKLSGIPKGESDQTEKDNQNSIFKDSKDALSPDHDPFFDEPLPSEKTSFFTFSETLKDKSEIKLTSSIKRDQDDSIKRSLSSLKDLPSLTANHEWTFSRDAKNTLPSLDSLKSVSSSETSNEEIINLDTKENFEKKDSDIAESNEESSEKQNSEESIEEEIEEDFSAGFDDLLNSSLSLADDVTTDQTVSQVSVVEGIDHVEPCNS